MKLTADEIKFLESQGLSGSDAFDTGDRRPAKISAAIKKAGKTKDTPENQARLKAASDMVKMFGGFFTGIATTLLAPH